MQTRVTVLSMSTPNARCPLKLFTPQLHLLFKLKAMENDKGPMAQLSKWDSNEPLPPSLTLISKQSESGTPLLKAMQAKGRFETSRDELRNPRELIYLEQLLSAALVK